MSDELLRVARLVLHEFRVGCDQLAYAIITAEEEAENIGWHFPIGTEEYPPEMWYVATVHDLSPEGKLNPGYGGPHTGFDVNLDVKPWGDVDRGMPVWAVADGVVHGTWHSERNLGSVVIKVVHDSKPLWVRYWHLARDDTFLAMRPGVEVLAGQRLGHIGAYHRGDHLHFDMATTGFHPGTWIRWAPDAGWIDPVPVLKKHLDVWLVEKMIERER